MRNNPIRTALATAGALSLLATPMTADAVMLNGVSCDEFTITGTTTNGALSSTGMNIEVHDCGPDGISPFDGGGGGTCGNGSVEGGEQCDGSDLAGQNCVGRGFDSGTLQCNNLCQFDTSNCANDAPPPTPTPAPPPPPSDGECPDGFMNEQVVTGQATFGVKGVSIRPGVTRRYCADIMPPLVGQGQAFDRIYLSWGDETDYVCGVVEVTMQQSFSPFKKAGPSTGTSGSLRLSRKLFRQPDCPECVAQGRYIVTVRGIQLYNPSDPKCEKFTLTWGVN